MVIPSSEAAFLQGLNPAQREALGKMLPDVTEFYSSLALNDRLWTVIKAMGESAEIQSLSAVQKRFVEETLADFRNSGADLPAEKKERIAASEEPERHGALGRALAVFHEAGGQGP